MNPAPSDELHAPMPLALDLSRRALQVRVFIASFALLGGLLVTSAAVSADCKPPPKQAHLFFVTDRAALDDDQLFSGERGLTKERDAIVTRGVITQPVNRKAVLRCNSRSEFLASLQSDFDPKRGRQVLIYVHGYYTTFRHAVRDAFAIAETLRFPGPIVVYSWPSKVTSRLSYINDEDNAGWSSVHYRNLLATLLTAYRGMPISFIAHSLGARFVADGMDFIRHGTCPKCVGRAVFFAPDIDGDTLRTGLTAAGRCSGRPPLAPANSAPVTVYVSNKDRALRQSQNLHGHQRAGQAGSEMLLCNGVDTIDVGYYKSSDSFGHSYQVDKPVIDDARAAFDGVSPASPKRKLTRATRESGTYYELRP